MTELGLEARLAGQIALVLPINPCPDIPQPAAWKPAIPRAAFIGELNPLLAETAVFCIVGSEVS